jgi:hypothetical protein
MMNGVLMSNGIDAISVPAQRAGDFDEKVGLCVEGRDADDGIPGGMPSGDLMGALRLNASRRIKPSATPSSR